MGLNHRIHEDEQPGSFCISMAHKLAPFSSYFGAARLRGPVTEPPVLWRQVGLPVEWPHKPFLGCLRTR